MNTSKKIRKLVEEGYQLTPEAFSYLNSIDDSDSIIDSILNSGTTKLILSVDDIKEITKQEVSVKEAVTEIIVLDEEQMAATVTAIVEIDDDNGFEEQEAENEVLDSEEPSQEIETDVNGTKQLEDVEHLFHKEKKRQTRIRKELSDTDLEVLYSPEITRTVASASSFRQYFENRFEVIRSYFSRRRDIINKITTLDLEPNSKRDNVALIAIVTKIQRTKKGNVILDLEDLDGMVTGLIHLSNQDLVQASQFILEDSVLCFTGNWRNGMLGIKEVLWPDIPFTHKPNYSYEEVLALHISDIHVGSKNFAGKLFHRAINFINGDLQDESYNRIGEKIKYLFVAGGLVDGVGVYPGQKLYHPK